MSSRPALPLRRLLLLAVFLWPLAAAAVEWVGTVVGIADGDTLTLLDGGKTTHRIRIDGIDAPERYVKYAHEQSPQARLDYAQAEEQARIARSGLWTVTTPTPPWDYRREQAARAEGR